MSQQLIVDSHQSTAESQESVAVRVENVGKVFKLPHEKHNSLKSSFINFRPRQRTFELQQALKDVSFEIKEGEFFGIVGRNGSGKSTLLKLLAGIYTPTSGLVKVNGSLTPFIELGVGFNPELTGRENIFLNGALLGFSRKEMQAMYSDIVEFAELKRFMDQKLKNYSSGMEVRLAFSIAIKVNSDILLLDEVLAVGDAAFQKKCFDYFRKLKKDKKTVVFISHDMNAVREYCDRAILIEKGSVLKSGSADAVAQEYTKLFLTDKQNFETDGIKRWGTGKVKIEKVEPSLQKSKITISILNSFKKAVEEPVFGLTITNPVGVKVYESNTKWQRVATGNFNKGDRALVRWEVPNIFTNGTNYISAAVANRDTTEFYDWWNEAAAFIVDKDEITTALTLVKSKIGIKKINAS